MKRSVGHVERRTCVHMPKPKAKRRTTGVQAAAADDDEPFDFEGHVPECWCCVDCGMNTAPGFLNRAAMEKVPKALGEKWDTEKEGITQTMDADTEVFHVRDAVWKEAGMAPWGGCLCIRCLEKRLGRRLRPKDFPREDVFNNPALRAARLLAGKRRTYGSGDDFQSGGSLLR